MHRSVAFVMVLSLTACTQHDGTQAGAPRGPDTTSPSLAQKSTSQEPPHDAVVQLSPTQGNDVSGSLALTRSPQGVRIMGAVQGLKPGGQFGFHIHEKGDCSAPDCSSAGAHFNPTQQQHGDPAGPAHHAGDMVNIRSNAEGVAQVDTTAAAVTIGSGAGADILGKAIVVHESADDYSTQPSGNSGKRIACGVIAVASG